MKKKKNIKVPAYAYGTSAPTLYLREVFGDKAFGGGSLLADFGTIMGLVPDAINLLSNPFRKSTATSGGEAAMQSISNMGKGASIGAAIGGPMGAGIGAGIGLIGSTGESATMAGFTDYNEGTLGTGIMGMFGNRGLRRKRREIKANAYNNRAAIQGSNYLQFEAAEDNALMNNLASAADGGVIPSLAYVDDGELLQTPDGLMLEVPELNKPTDSNLVSLPEGSMVLSDKLKFPGTKKSIAQVGKEMMKTPKSKGKDRFAENSKMLNERNNKMIYDLLFAVLELLKELKGIKPKTKKMVLAAADGDIIKVKDPRLATNSEIAKPNFNTISSIPSLSGPITPTKQLELNNLYNLGENRRKIASRDRKNLERQDRFNKISDGIQTAFSGIGDVAPILSNLFAKSGDPVLANHNPYAQSILNTMRGRRFNIQPAIDDLGRNRAIANYNMRNINTGTGANMAYSLLSATNADRAIQSLRAQESNANNAYLGEYANTANNLGQQWVGATNMAQDLNALNAAASRNIRRTGLSQWSQWSQTRQLANNQKNRDNAMMQLYAPFLQSAFTKNTMNNFDYYNSKGGNNVG